MDNVEKRPLISKRNLVQDTGKNCVANSVRNLFPRLALKTLFTNFDENARVGALPNLFAQNYKSLSLVKAHIQQQQICSYLMHSTTTGKYLLPTEKGKHCIAVDADRGIIMESDPKFPVPLPLNYESFKLFSVNENDLSKLYRVIQK